MCALWVGICLETYSKTIAHKRIDDGVDEAVSHGHPMDGKVAHVVGIISDRIHGNVEKSRPESNKQHKDANR